MDNWPPTLFTPPLIKGPDLAIQLSRVAVSAIFATHFATIAATNGHWRDAT